MRIIKKWGQMRKRKYHRPQTGTCKAMHCAAPHGAGNLLSILIWLQWSAVLIAVPGFRGCAIPACHNHCASQGWIAFTPGELVWLLAAHNDLKTSLFLVINLYGSCKVGLYRLVRAESQLQLTSGLGRLLVCMEIRWGCQEKGKLKIFLPLVLKPHSLAKYTIFFPQFWKNTESL